MQGWHTKQEKVYVVVNKWDLPEKETNTMSKFRREIAKEMTFMSYAPSLFISVLKHQRVDQVLGTAKTIAENRKMRIPTGKLNSLLSEYASCGFPQSFLRFPAPDPLSGASIRK